MTEHTAENDALHALAAKWEAEAEAGRNGNGHPLLVQTYAGHARELRAALASVFPPGNGDSGEQE